MLKAPRSLAYSAIQKREVDEVAGRLQQMGYPAGAIHGRLHQSHRDEMMRKFKGGDIDILVATDVAARDWTYLMLSHVINFSIPKDPGATSTELAGQAGINPALRLHLSLLGSTAS